MTTASWTGISIVVHTIARSARGEILLLERMNTGYMDGFYSLPGGHVEPGESATHAAIREICEESELVVEFVCPRVVMPFDGGVDIIFEAQEWEGVPTIGEPDRCSRIGWFHQHLLPQNVAPFVPKALELIENGVWYFEFHD